MKNHEFVDTLVYDGYTRGRSSVKIRFVRNSTNTIVEMFMTDFDDMMEKVGLNIHSVTGRFEFVKRGINYGVKFLGPASGG